MSTAAVQQMDVASFTQSAQRGFPDYTTSTGHKLFKQDDSYACVWCGAPTSGRPSNEGVFACSHAHWKEFVNLPEFKAWGNAAFEADLAYSLALQQWKNAGLNLRARANKIRIEGDQLQFAIGDWFVTGEERGFLGGRNYPEAERITGYSLSSLRNFAYVARHVPASIRNGCLPWGIHQLLAPLKDIEDQKRILQQAADPEKPLSVAKVRDLVKSLPSTIVPKSNEEHEIVSGTKSWRDEDVSAAGKDGVIAQTRMNKWWSGVLSHLLTPDKKVEEAWQFFLPRMSPSKRTETAEKLRDAAAYLTAQADYIERFQPAR